MSKDRSHDLRDIGVGQEPEQIRSLLAPGLVDDDIDGLTPAHQLPPFPHSSLSRTLSSEYPSAPRTVDRVRFDEGETGSVEHILNGHARTPSQDGGDWPEAEDYLSGNETEIRNSAGQRAPLLTDVEAPSITVAEDLDFNAEGLLENARPKSGLT